MKIVEVKYARRFNTAKYEHEEYALVATSDGDENPVELIQQMKGAVASAHEADQIPWGENSENEDAPKGKKSSKIPSKTKTKNKVEEDDGEEEEIEDDEEDSDEEEDAEDDDASEDEESDDSSEDDEDEEEAPAKKKKVAKKTAGKKTFKKKGSVYSRNSDVHKKIFAETLNKEVPGLLKKNAGRAKTISIKMEGKDFLDSEGQVVASFISEMKKMAKAKVA